MYVIKADGIEIHATGSADKKRTAIVAGLTLEFNKSGSLNLTLPPNHFAVKGNLIKKLKTEITVWRVYLETAKADGFIWKGRVLDTSRDFYGRVTYKCEGWLSVLCDSIVRPTIMVDNDNDIIANPGDMFTSLIESHNDQMGNDTAKKFTVHTYGFTSEEGASHSQIEWGSYGDDVTLCQKYLNKCKYPVGVDGVFGEETDSAVRSFQEDNSLTVDGIVGSTTWEVLETAAGENTHHTASSAAFPNGNYENTLDYIQTNFLSNIEIGGRIWVVGRDIYYYAEGHEDYATQAISFGENLLDFTEYVDASEIYTVLIPVGKDDLTLTDTYGVDYVENDEAVALFGRIIRKEDYSEIEDAESLYNAAVQTLSENIEESTTINISAFDLSLLNIEYDMFYVGEYVRVMSEPHGFDTYYLCTGQQVDLCDPARSSYTLGINPDTLTGRYARNRAAAKGSSSSSSSGSNTIREGEFWAVDVSMHNGNIDWSTAVGVLDVAVIRVCRNNLDTGEYDTIDPYFLANYQGATNVGLDVGVYAYIGGNTVERVRHEAQAVVSILVNNHCTLKQPVWFDMEEVKYESMGTSTITAMIEAFREVVEGAGYYFGIYTNRNWWSYLMPSYAKSKYPFWIAAFPVEDQDNGQPQEYLRPSYGVGWQYSGKGNIPGFQNYTYDPYLDMDVFYRTWPARTGSS